MEEDKAIKERETGHREINKNVFYY